MKALVVPFILLAAAGLVLSLLVHVSALVGLPNVLGSAAWGLHVGIFVVWLPAVIVAGLLTRDARRMDMRKVALRACPRWMRYMTYGFFIYAILNFAVFFLGSFASGGEVAESDVFRGFSGHWMAFYSAALALLYSFWRADTSIRRCINGHKVSATANYCEICGQPVQEQEHDGFDGSDGP